MKIKSAEFLTSAASLDACPPNARPEFAFIGRSNVGKSSLINLLTERRDLAKVSGTPGKTVLINFFLVNQAWVLVDLPGYGYAQTGRSHREGFGAAVDDYIENRESLTHLFVLIDSRLEPQQIDLDFLEWVERLELPHSLIFTKVDKQSATQTARAIAAFQAVLAKRRAEPPQVFTSSATTKKGRAEILAEIERLSHAPSPVPPSPSSE